MDQPWDQTPIGSERLAVSDKNPHQLITDYGYKDTFLINK